MDWIRYGIRSRLLRGLFNPGKPRPLGFEVDFFGLRYHGTFGNSLDWEVFFFGAYETYVLAFLRDAASALATSQLVFLDVGANVGHHTLFMTRHAAVVQAFEPYAPVRRALERRVAENTITNVMVHPVALGAQDGAMTYFAPVGTNMGAGGFVAGTEGIERRVGDALDIVNGDRYFAAHGLHRVDLMKIDAEGFEVFILRGLAGVIERNRPIILMEFDRRTREHLEGESDLTALAGRDYLAFVLEGPRPILKVFSEPAARWRIVPFRWEGRRERNYAEVLLVPAEKQAILPAAGPRSPLRVGF